MSSDRLALARWEADRHAAVLADALAEWDAMPATPSLEALEGDRHLRQLTDQLLFRFMKLQDAIGERLVPATLGWLAEPFEPWPMRDRLDRLEKLGFIDVGQWLHWRETSNRLAHEYPDAPVLRHAQVLAAVETARALVSAYGAWSARLPVSGSA